MSLFHKLLQWCKPKAPTPVLKIETPRAPRARIEALHNIHFMSPRWSPPNVPVLNLSTTGLALSLDSEPDEPIFGFCFAGLLYLKDNEYPVLLRVIRVTDHLVGCRFEGDISNLEQIIQEYLTAEIAAATVNKVNPKLLKADERGSPHWYFSSAGEIYLVEKENRIKYFHISILGHYMEAYEDQAPRFGVLLNQEGESKLKHEASTLIEYIPQVSRKNLKLFRQFVQHVKDIDPKHKTYILSVLEEVKT